MESPPQPESDDPAVTRLYRQRQDCVERIGRITKVIVEYHKAQDFNVHLLLDINDRIRLAEAPHYGDD